VPGARRIGGFDVCRIDEAHVAVHDETEWRRGLRMQLHWLRVREKKRSNQQQQYKRQTLETDAINSSRC
jgi:hypothetical protein